MTSRKTTRILAVLTASAMAIFVSACNNPQPASDGHTDHSYEEEAPVIGGEPAAYNAEDVAFATNMVPHHEQALELSALVPERSTNPEVIQLAQAIEAAQEPEIATMKAFLVQWNENPDTQSGHEGHGAAGMHGMEGMVDGATMARLESLNGAEFDTLWLQSMIAHHEGAIEMAKTELATGENVDAKQLAQHVIDAQQTEIDQMRTLLGGD